MIKPEIKIVPTWKDLEESGKIRGIEDKVNYAIRYPELFHVWPLGYNYNWHQSVWLRLAETNQYLLLIAPNDHGKSLTMSISYAIYRIVRNRNIRIALVGRVEDLAKLAIVEIQEQMERNEDLDYVARAIYDAPLKPEKPKKWSDLEFTVSRPGYKGLKDSTVVAVGYRGSLANRRVDLALLDDVIDIKDYETGTNLVPERIKRWLTQTLWTRLGSAGEIKIIGTLQSHGDLYNYILTGENEAGTKLNDVFCCSRWRSLAKKDERFIY